MNISLRWWRCLNVSIVYVQKELKVIEQTNFGKISGKMSGKPSDKPIGKSNIKSKQLSIEVVKKMVNLYETSRINQRDLALQFGISKSSVNRILKANNITIRKEKRGKIFFDLLNSLIQHIIFIFRSRNNPGRWERQSVNSKFWKPWRLGKICWWVDASYHFEFFSSIQHYFF